MIVNRGRYTFFPIETYIHWHSGARRSCHPPRRSSQSRLIFIGTRGLAAAATPRGVLRNSDLYSLALGGSPQLPPPEAFFAIATYSNWHSGARRSCHPRAVLRNHNLYSFALGGSPQPPPPEALFARVTIYLTSHQDSEPKDHTYKVHKEKAYTKWSIIYPPGSIFTLQR